ncbi:MAG: hypothetical protein A2Y16_03905 [Tenericutes bacterium GWF2_57_13]|nr:MAG: hypothetical protein A2Y16_03905 [Tenericutes bacterium GWF2_57_13]
MIIEDVAELHVRVFESQHVDEVRNMLHDIINAGFKPWWTGTVESYIGPSAFKTKKYLLMHVFVLITDYTAAALALHVRIERVTSWVRHTGNHAESRIFRHIEERLETEKRILVIEGHAFVITHPLKKVMVIM